MPSWAGYGYQGQCAMLHAVKLLCEDRDAVKGYYLSLESYEDFAIMDGAERIVSLHQCKCYSEPEDFTVECQKMSDKREYFSKELKKCADDVPYFFMSNIVPKKTLVCDVKAYEFATGKTTCDPDKIIGMIEEAVGNYMHKYGCPHSENAKANILANMVQNKVAMIHQKKKETGADFWQIATSKDSWIPFEAIIEKIEEDDDCIKSDTLRAIVARNAISTNMTNCLNDERVYDDFSTKETVVNGFLERLNRLDDDDLVAVIRRLHPHVEWNLNCTTELKVSEKGNNLYRLLTSVKELSDYDTLSWNEDGVLETPSTLGQDRKSVFLAEKIRKSPVLAFLRDYRWIVGNIDESIPDIIDKAPSMMDVTTDGETERFTRPSRLGLLSIKDKNDPDYEKNNS